MTVVVNARDDFTLANFSRVSYGGEPVRIGAVARRAMTASAGQGPAAGSPERKSVRPARRAVPGPDFGGGYLEAAVVRGILFARLAGLVAGPGGGPPSVAGQVAPPPAGPMPRGA